MKVLLPISLLVAAVVAGLGGEVLAAVAPAQAVPAAVAPAQAVSAAEAEAQGAAAKAEAKRETTYVSSASVNADIAHDAAGVEPNAQQKRSSIAHPKPLSGKAKAQAKKKLEKLMYSSSSSEESTIGRSAARRRRPVVRLHSIRRPVVPSSSSSSSSEEIVHRPRSRASQAQARASQAQGRSTRRRSHVSSSSSSSSSESSEKGGRRIRAKGLKRGRQFVYAAPVYGAPYIYGK